MTTTSYRDPQPMFYDGRRYGPYGPRAPFTELDPGAPGAGVTARGIKWDQPIRRVPADRVEGLLADGFRLALLLPEAARRYDVAQDDIRAAISKGILHEEEDRGETYVIFDPGARKKVAQLRASRLDGGSGETTESEA